MKFEFTKPQRWCLRYLPPVVGIFLKPHTIATSDFITTYYSLCTTNIIIISSPRCDMWLRPWTLVTKPRWLFMLPGTQRLEPFGSDRENGEESGQKQCEQLVGGHSNPSTPNQPKK